MNTANTSNLTGESRLAEVIEIWQLLRTDASPEILLPKLIAVSDLSLLLRFPLFGVLPTAFEHKDPRIRSAALQLIAGATGPIAWKQIVEGLDDSEPSVRNAAVHALRISAEEDPLRLMHGLFHPNPSVREALCSLPWLNAGWPYYLHLLADETCRERVLYHISKATIEQETLQQATALFVEGHLDEGTLLRMIRSRFRTTGYSETLSELINDAIRSRILNRQQIAEIVSNNHPAMELFRAIRPLCESSSLPKFWESQALSQLRLDEVFLLTWKEPARQPREVRHLLQSARSERGLDVLHKTPMPDILDELLDLFWLPQSNGLAMTPRWFDAGSFSWERLRQWSYYKALPDTPKEFPMRLAAALFLAAHRHGQWHPEAALLCANCDPRFLTTSSVPLEVRQQAIEAMCHSTSNIIDWVPPKLAKSLISREARKLIGMSLRLIAIYARLLPEKRLETVVYLIGFPRIVEAAREDLEGAFLLFQFSDDLSKHSLLFAAIADKGRSYVTVATRLAFSIEPQAWLAFIGELTYSACVQVAIEIARLEGHGESPGPLANLPRIGELLGDRLVFFYIGPSCLQKEWQRDLGRDLPFAERLWSRMPSPVQQEAESQSTIPDHSHPAPSVPGPPVVILPTPRRTSEVRAIQQKIVTSTDLEELAGWCADHSSSIAEDAALRLTELGCAAIQRLAQVIREQPAVCCSKHLAWTVSFWPVDAARDSGLQIFADESLADEVRFVVGLGLLEHGCDVFDALVKIANANFDEPWMTSELWDRIQQHDREALARHLVWTDRPASASWAFAVLENANEQDQQPGIFDELLRRDPERIPFETAAMLWRNRRIARPEMFPLLMYFLARDWGSLPGSASRLFMQGSAEQLDELVTATLIVGSKTFEDFKLQTLVENCGVLPSKIDALRRVILEARDTATRENAANQLQQVGFVSPKFARLVQIFVWGIRKSRVLLKREFRIRMLGTGDMGYTELKHPVIYVSTIPLLAGHRHGKDIVEGLILHELGHHLYHNTDEHSLANAIASDEKLFTLLNIVNDEHLERNLRGKNSEYGDRFKKLAAYAFQHLERELPVEMLLSRLGHRVFRVLTRCRLKPARQTGHVVIKSGEVLMELERAGAGFPRFLRGLRMGLGNRHNDPKVAAGLALFGRSLRNSTADEQLTIARKLREIFQDESDLLDAFENSSAFPPLESRLRAAAEGLHDGALQAAIDKALSEGEDERESSQPRQPNRKDDDSGLNYSGGINRATDETFLPLTNIVTVPYHRAAHAVYAKRVGEQARRLRECLKDLGRSHQSDRNRISGARFDSSRAAALVLRGDPRVMISRKLNRANDLFLAVLVDCSGSMSGERLEHAKLFATLVSEATRGMSGIDLRHFGFTHDTIFEAGDANRCGVDWYHSTGGNNDAGALWHAAKAAFRSKRRAKVLVMISDGAPSDCSVGALRNLVQKLSRQHRMICAQVAVAPLTDICFPYHVTLDPADWRESVRRFGTIIANLVTKAMA